MSPNEILVIACLMFSLSLIICGANRIRVQRELEFQRKQARRWKMGCRVFYRLVCGYERQRLGVSDSTNED